MKENRFVFVPVPASFAAAFPLPNTGDGGFSIDPDIPIPVEISGNGNIELKELSPEMILSAMLRVIEAGNEKKEWIGYYRRFVLAFRPGIMAEFTGAAVGKARNGDFDGALDILSCLRGLFPFSPAVSLNLALVLEEKAARRRKLGKEGWEKTRDAAAAVYEELLWRDPPFPRAVFNGGCFFHAQGDFGKAAEYFSRYLEIAEDGEKRKRAKEALKEIRDNGLDEKCFMEARLSLERGNAKEGLSSIREFLEGRPLAWNGWFMLGWALRLLGRWKDGAAAFKKAIELGGDGGDARNELAICLMETGDISGARRELETALAQDADNVKIISNLGVLALKEGDKEKAAAFFRAVLELDGGDPVAGRWAGINQNIPAN
ncbi:MAG: tetratricopeptide repeat protein [Treponema sp.]|jgi:tetratricopeptide (TPR) repeat protein|nr:tetratricopeptide repeat protein [Treponema sp.]